MKIVSSWPSINTLRTNAYVWKVSSKVSWCYERVWSTPSMQALKFSVTKIFENFNPELYADSQHPGDKMAMRSSPLSTPCKLSMSDHDIHLMQAFRVQLAQVGITFVNVPRSSSDVHSSVCIKTVPSVFLAREFSRDGEKLRSEIKNCIEVLMLSLMFIILFISSLFSIR